MSNKEIPLHIPGIQDNIYAGFGPRLASLLLDFLFLLPLGILTIYINSLGKNMYVLMLFINLAFGLWYNIYLPKKYWGTPGKMMAGIRILRLDARPVGWKEAILRHIVMLALSLLYTILMIVMLNKADDETLQSLSWIEQSQYLVSLSPLAFSIYAWVSNIWIYGELIVLLTNRRKRAVHDFIAGTVIVKAKYIAKIQELMYAEETTHTDYPAENND